jgi:hypothetical protein
MEHEKIVKIRQRHTTIQGCAKFLFFSSTRRFGSVYCFVQKIVYDVEERLLERPQQRSETTNKIYDMI